MRLMPPRIGSPPRAGCGRWPEPGRSEWERDRKPMANMLYDALFAPLAGRDRAFLILPDGTEISGDGFLAMVHRVAGALVAAGLRSEEHTSELQSRPHLVCRLLLEKKKKD